MSHPTDPADETEVGNLEWRRADYVHIQTALRMLHAELGSWNAKAISRGAKSSPYEYEVQAIGEMVMWAEPLLANEGLHKLRVNGITVESLRFIKAALLLANWKYEAEASTQANEGWPQRVVDAVQDRARSVKGLAAQIEFQPAEILQDVLPGLSRGKVMDGDVSWDVFISHASEDKTVLVDALAKALQAAGLTVWYDAFTLTLGDSLRRSIDKGLARSKFGVVVLSPAFFSKEWPQRELDGLVSREIEGEKVILPVWHTVSAEHVRQFSPTLADRLGISSERGVEAIASAILQAVRK